MSFLEAFPARTYPAPEKEQGLTGRDQVCGDTWRELLVKFDQSSAWWKTAHCLWEEALPESSVTLPRWGMMRSGECWEREMPEHLTSGTGSGLLESYPTPNCFDAIPDFGDRQDNNLENGGRHGVSLRHLVKMWPTPTCADSWNPSTMKSAEREWTQGNLRGIAAAPVKMWPTPTAGNHKSAGRMDKWEGSGSRASIAHLPKEERCGQLNPNWVEWLMGWPIGWTDLNALATDKCPTAQPWLGES